MSENRRGGGIFLLTLYILTYWFTVYLAWQSHDLQQTLHCG